MSAIDVDKNWQLLIDGEWVDPAAGTYDVVDPATTEIVGHAPEASVQQAQDAAAAAKAAALGWKNTSREDRCEIIGRLADEGHAPAMVRVEWRGCRSPCRHHWHTGLCTRSQSLPRLDTALPDLRAFLAHG